LLTFFTIPKPFKGYIDVIQRNAIASWKKIDPSVEIILFGIEDGVAQIAKEFNIKHVPDIESNEYGTPYVSDLFEKVQKIAQYDLICFVNCDILLFSNLLDAINRMNRTGKGFFFMGKKKNIDYNNNINIQSNNEKEVMDYIKEFGSFPVGAGTGMDYLVFNKGLIKKMPKFLIGRPVWDNWVMWFAANSKYPFVDCTDIVTALHQNHTYHHVPNGRNGSWEGPEADYNRSLLVRSDQICTIKDATYVLTKRWFRPSIKGHYRKIFRHIL